MSDLCSVQCFKLCALILQRPIFKALSVSQYGLKARGQKHMVNSSTLLGHVCMNVERERRSFIDYAYMVKEILFLLLEGAFLKNTYIVKGWFQQHSNQVDGYTGPQIKWRESKSHKKEQKRLSCRAVRKCPCAAHWTGPKTNKLKLNHRKMAELHVESSYKQRINTLLSQSLKTIFPVLPVTQTKRGQSCLNNSAAKPGRLFCFVLFF